MVIYICRGGKGPSAEVAFFPSTAILTWKNIYTTHYVRQTKKHVGNAEERVSESFNEHYTDGKEMVPDG